MSLMNLSTNIRPRTVPATARQSTLAAPSICACSDFSVAPRAADTSSASASTASSVPASDSASRHSICCIRKAGGIAVLLSASRSTPCSEQRYAARASGFFRRR